MDFSFFITDNKSGYKTTEKWLSKNEPDIYIQIIDYSKNLNIDLSFKEKIYFYFHKMTQRPRCICCGDEIKFRERFDKPYGDFCSLSCANESKDELVKRQKETFNKKYGIDFYPQHIEFVKKQKQTKQIKYGDENYNNSQRGKNTKKEKYGDVNYNNIQKQKETCIVKYGVDNYAKSNNYKNKLIDNYQNLYPNINFIDIKKGSAIILCPNCNTESELTKQLIYERNKRNYDVCLTCNPIGFNQRSGYEDDISNTLKTLGIDVICNYKIPNTRNEIDIFIPKYNLGIEFNGVYWHNELFKTTNYHLDKTNRCKELGIDLIHIFEDEWIYKQEIIVSILKNKLGITETKLYGRKCEIREVTTTESQQFLEENHIQGNVNSSVRLGLYYNNTLVSLMTFSRGRIIMGGKQDEWELNRFCNKLNTNVIGAASKLLNHFIKTTKPKKIVSYSDVRIFGGKMYERLDFKHITQSKPNYWYVIGDKRHYRFNFNKSKLVKLGYDPNKTEKEIMFERKIYRIYDCGNVRWELTID